MEQQPLGEQFAPQGPTARIASFFRRRITAGLVYLIPFVLTIWLAIELFLFADGILGPYVNHLLVDYGLVGEPVPAAGLLLLLVVLFSVGFFATSKIGRQITYPFERLLLSIPVIKSVYGGSKQILQAFTLGQGGAFQRVCLIEYPRREMFALGFVTGQIIEPIQTPEGIYSHIYTVFVPTTPNPTSGFLILSPAEQTFLLDMSVEDGIKIILSGGVVQADLDLITRTLSEERSSEAPSSGSAGSDSGS